MKLFLLIIFSLTLTSPKAQNPITPTQEFFTYFYSTQNKQENKFIYKKGINTNMIQQFAPRLDTLISWLFKDKMLQKVDTLILTSEEKQHLVKALQNQSDTSIWNHMQFPNSIEIAQDSISAILNDKTRGWDYIYKNYGRQIYTLGLPIFFRNNQYCLLYYGKSCGESCSESHFVLYKKVSGVWVKGTTIYESYT